MKPNTRKIKRNSNNKRHSSKKMPIKRGGSLGLDKLGYGWNGSKVATWPGAMGNTNGITQSNHMKLSPYGVPVGGVKLPYSTYADKTGNSSKHVPTSTYKLIGGFRYSNKKSSIKKRSTNKRGSTKMGGARHNKKSNKKSKKGGYMFSDAKNFARYLATGVKSQINGIRGINKPISPLPANQPYIDKDVNVIISKPIDINSIYKTNSENVAKI